MWAHIIIAPRSAIERWSRMFRGTIQDIYRAFLMFPTKFSDKGEVSYSIEGPLDL